jgi:O-antigen ligase
MGDSGLTVYLGMAAWAIVVLALVITAVAWRIPKRPVRIGIGLGLMVLALLGGGLSLGAWLLVTGLGTAVLILGIRTRRPDSQDRGSDQ